MRWACTEVGGGGGPRGETYISSKGRDASARERCGSEIARGGVARDCTDPAARFASEGEYPHSTRLSATPLSAIFLFLPAPDRLAVCLCPTISLLSAEDDQPIQATPRGGLDSSLCSSVATEDALPTRVSKCVRAVRAGRPASRWHTERGLWVVERPIQ